MSEADATEGRNIPDWKQEASYQAMRAVEQAEDVAAQAAQVADEAVTRAAEQQREFRSEAAEQFGSASRRFAQDNAEKMHPLLSFASATHGGLRELQECFGSLV